jgi:hypothetical protein
MGKMACKQAEIAVAIDPQTHLCGPRLRNQQWQRVR